MGNFKVYLESVVQNLECRITKAIFTFRTLMVSVIVFVLPVPGGYQGPL